MKNTFKTVGRIARHIYEGGSPVEPLAYRLGLNVPQHARLEFLAAALATAVLLAEIVALLG